MTALRGAALHHVSLSAFTFGFENALLMFSYALVFGDIRIGNPCASTTMWPTRSRFVTFLVPSAFRFEPRFFLPPGDVAFCSALIICCSYRKTATSRIALTRPVFSTPNFLGDGNTFTIRLWCLNDRFY